MATRSKNQNITVNSVIGATATVIILLVLLYYNMLILVAPFNEKGVTKFVVSSSTVVEKEASTIPGIDQIDIDHWIVKKFVDLPGVLRVFWWFVCLLYSVSFIIAIPTGLCFLFEPKRGPLGLWNRFLFGKDG